MARIKEVHTASMVCHLWAHQTQERARHVNHGNKQVYFEGRDLYSYGSHYLVGRILADDAVLLNADSSTQTTNAIRRDAASAVSHKTAYKLPGLTLLVREVLDALTPSEYERKHYAKHARKSVAYAKNRLRLYIEEHGEIIGAEAGRYLIKLAGLRAPTKTYKELILSGQKKVERAKTKRARFERKRDLADAKCVANVTDAEFRKTFPPDGTNAGTGHYDYKRCHNFAKNLARLHRVSKAADFTNRTAELWRKVKLYRAWLAKRDDRIRKAYRKDLADQVRAWRAGTAEAPRVWLFENFPAIKNGINKADETERTAAALESFNAWQAGTDGRPSLHAFAEGSPQYVTIAASEAAERAINEAAYLAWQADNTQPRPHSREFLDSDYSPKWKHADGSEDYHWTLAGDELATYAKANPFYNAYHVLTRAETAEKAEAERTKRAAELSDWYSGVTHSVRDDGNKGARLRARGVTRAEDGHITGGTLQTSVGADVPLVHAVRVFRFLKKCRDVGKGWKHNGHSIRVGHFSVDSVDKEGNFVAGCHRINWPEVERLAKELGVFTDAASDEALEPTAHAA